ncbi:MAG: polysulfide reductase NrfD, partial [Campylobacter sp.]|nr:polysulfide reductase NrfD [Campylobacter sp.]
MTTIAKNKDFRLLFVALALCCIGLVGIALVFFNGQEASYGVSREIPFGLLLMGYAFFVGISVGVATIATADHLFGFHAFSKISRHLQLLAISALLAAFWLIFWELGSPFKLQVLRFVHYYFNFAVESPIWWMSTFYLIETPLLIIELILMLKGDEKSSFLAGIVAFIMGIIAFSTLSMVFAVNAARPIWNTPSFTISFIFGALICGISVIFAFVYLTKKSLNERILRNLNIFMFLLLLAVLFINFWNAVILSYGAGSYLAKNFEVFTNGNLSFNFYFFEICIGILLPMILLILSKFSNLKFSVIAGILAIIGVFFARFDGIVGGQLVRVESEFLGKIEFGSYCPSVAEITIFISGIGVMLFIYALGKTFLNLESEK